MQSRGDAKLTIITWPADVLKMGATSSQHSGKGRCIIRRKTMFEGILSFLTPSPKRSETDEKLDEALTNARQLDHYFFFSDQADADRAAQRLQERGWTIESVSLNAEVEKVQLQARQPGPIENLNALQTELDLFANEFNGEYDGWQVPGVTEHL
jgi:hypothetical protein